MTEPTEQLKKYGDSIADAVSLARSQVAAMEAVGKVADEGAAAGRSGWRRLQVVVASVAAIVVVNVGLAGIADAAVPGDLLYPLDRTYERLVDWIGGERDRMGERVHEAEVLVERNDIATALDLIMSSSDDADVREVARLLLVTDLDEPILTAQARSFLQGLRILTIEDPGGRSRAEALAAVRLIGEQVEELGRGASGNVSDGPEGNVTDGPGQPAVTGPSEQAGQTGPPDQAGTQGPPDHAGDPGPPDHAGQTGPPDHANPPGQDEGTSPPDHAGQTGPPDHAGDQGPPDHAGQTGPPDHAGDPGPPDHAGQTGPPDHAGDPGPPDHAGQTGPPDHASDQGPPDHSGQTGPPDHANPPGQGGGGNPGPGGPP